MAEPIEKHGHGKVVLAAEGFLNVGQQLHARCHDLVSRPRDEIDGGSARRSGPVTASRIRNGDKWFPTIRRTIDDPVWKFRLSADELGFYLLTPFLQGFPDGSGFTGVIALTELLNAFARRAALHSKDD